jgi:thiamine-phosphate pyrophosphorylase
MLQRSPRKALDRLRQARLYVILTSRLCKGPILETARLALEGGADIIQLREKDMPNGEMLRLARELRELTSKMGRLFIVNDRPRIALESGADGLHLGQGDVPVGEARKLLGKDFIIGLSTHSLVQAERACREGADYIGIGPIFLTDTKDAGSPLGTGSLTPLRGLSIPYFAIGGINLANLGEVVKAGAERVAVCSAIISQDDVLGVTRRFNQSLLFALTGLHETV